jgi:superfamily II DNA or RNA helicase
MTIYDHELRTIEVRLLELERERESLLERKQALILTKSSIQDLPDQRAQPLSTQQKVDLFRSIFRGREEVHAVRWENNQGRHGYALACDNEWKKGLCHKPKIKCGECRSQAFQPLDHEALYEHLTGQRIAGLYPLLDDDKTWLLVVDFDKSDWQRAASAFRESCGQWEIPCGVERSRSGNGAHVWIFFEEALPAKDARRLGFALLDKAMERHAVISFDSYDRLFPNQDTQPKGGFGNLIALPLQRGPRQSGNTEFVDEGFKAYSDQWAFLQALRKVGVKHVYDCLDKLDSSSDQADKELKPWEKGLPLQKGSIANCPETVELIFANRIYLPIGELPQVLLARLKRIASFSNPVFFKTQALRFSTHGIPRFISLSHIDQGYISLPRGCMDDVLALLKEQSICIEIDDKRMVGRRLLGLKFKGELRKDQKKAVSALVKHHDGVLHAPTAFGKTVTAIGLIQRRKVSTLILVHNRQLLDQWRERLNMFLEGCKIGVISGGKKKPTGEVDVATYQSMINPKDNSVNEALFDYGQIIIDECHHLSAPRYEALLTEARAKYVLGMTATPQRQDGHQPIIFMLAGPIRHTVKTDSRHQFEQRVIVRQLSHEPPPELLKNDGRPHIADIYRWLMEDGARNRQIIDDVVVEVKQSRHPIVLTERREHTVALGKLLDGHGIRYQILRGAMKAKDRKAALDALSHTQVLIATGKYIGEGFDLPKLDTLFLALPISWKGSLSQYAGRIHRQSKGKERVTIYDYVDYSVPTLQRMYGRRSKAYEALGYTITDGQDSALIQVSMGFADSE